MRTLDPTFPAFAPIPHACAITGIGRTTLYKAIGRGDIAARKVGRRTLIDVQQALTWLHRQPAPNVKAPSL